MSTRYRAIAAAVAVLVGSGLACQLLATDSGLLDVAVARVPEAPRVVGAWQAQDEPAEEAAFANAGAKGYWNRLYVHQQTKDAVLAILMCGRSGKMAVHTPEVCYRGAGFEMSAPASVIEIEDASGGPAARFWTAQFSKSGTSATKLRLYWGWNAHGNWDAAAAPRWDYRGAPFLYKLYVSRAGSSARAAENDPAIDFLRQFVPVLHRSLFPQ